MFSLPAAGGPQDWTEVPRSRVVAVTASRNVPKGAEFALGDAAQRIVQATWVQAVLFGGARGGDTIALVAARAAKGERKLPFLVVVVPDTLDEQPEAAAQAARLCADAIVELRNEITAADGFAAFHVRNRYLVDHAAHLVGYGTGRPGGTMKTLAYAAGRASVTEYRVFSHGLRVVRRGHKDL